MKAGKAYYISKSKARKYPYVSRIKMHHSDHPFGGSGKRRVGRPRHSSRHAPPGSKVGSIAPKRQGYRK
jgi:large subunit ribosomal protein L2